MASKKSRLHEKRKRGDALAATIALAVYNRIIRSFASQTVTATMIARMADKRIPDEEISRARSGCLAPIDWATNVPVALARDKGNM